MVQLIISDCGKACQSKSVRACLQEAVPAAAHPQITFKKLQITAGYFSLRNQEINYHKAISINPKALVWREVILSLSATCCSERRLFLHSGLFGLIPGRIDKFPVVSLLHLNQMIPCIRDLPKRRISRSGDLPSPGDGDSIHTSGRYLPLGRIRACCLGAPAV